MDINKITADPNLYRATLPDDLGIIQKPLHGPTRARRGPYLPSVESDATQSNSNPNAGFSETSAVERLLPLEGGSRE